MDSLGYENHRVYPFSISNLINDLSVSGWSLLDVSEYSKAISDSSMNNNIEEFYASHRNWFLSFQVDD